MQSMIISMEIQTNTCNKKLLRGITLNVEEGGGKSQKIFKEIYSFDKSYSCT